MPDAQSNGEVLDTSDAKSICRLYCDFLILKPHIVGTLITSASRLQDLGMSKEGIGLKFIGIQLSFFYDILHTKATLVHCIAFHVIRIASLVAMVIAFFFFHITEKRGYKISDLIITYILLSVALFLEICSALRLVLSKWMTILLLRLNKKGAIEIANFILGAKNYIFFRGNEGQWSGRMGQYSLIQSFLKDQESNWFKKAWDFFKKAWDFLFVGEESAEVLSTLEETMKEHVKTLVKSVTRYEHVMNLLRDIRSSWIMEETLDNELTDIKSEVKTFEQCVMAWHMVTEICYWTSNYESAGSEDQAQMREASNRVSNYMMYLLLKRTSMMPPGIAKITKEEILIDFRVLWCNSPRDIKKASQYLYIELLRGGTRLSRLAPGNNSWSVMGLVRVLLEKLTEREDERAETVKVRWEVIRDAWMDMLTYSAVHCIPSEHARGLSKGSELLTYYWLLMAHHGIIDEYNAVSRETVRALMKNV